MNKFFCKLNTPRMEENKFSYTFFLGFPSSKCTFKQKQNREEKQAGKRLKNKVPTHQRTHRFKTALKISSILFSYSCQTKLIEHLSHRSFLFVVYKSHFLNLNKLQFLQYLSYTKSITFIPTRIRHSLYLSSVIF